MIQRPTRGKEVPDSSVTALPHQKPRTRAAFFGAGAFAFVLVGAAFFDPVAIVNANVDVLAALASGVVERRLTIGSIDGRILPRLDVTIDSIALGAEEASARPAVVVSSVRLDFDWLRALGSGGRALHLDSVQIDGLVAHVRRDHEGRFDIADVLDRLPPLLASDLEHLVVGAVVITDASIGLIDEAVSPVEVVVDRLDVVVDAVTVGQPLHVRAHGRWSPADIPAPGTGGTDGTSGDLELWLEKLPADLNFWPPPRTSGRLTLPRTDLVNGLAWLRLPTLFAAGDADVVIDLEADFNVITAVVDVEGSAISAVATEGAGAGVEEAGSEGVARLRGEVSVSTLGFRTSIEHLVFTGAGISIEGSGSFFDGSWAGLEDADVIIEADELARLALIVPALRDTAPGALLLSGRGSARLKATAEHLDVDLNLTPARVNLGQALSKPAGQHLEVIWSANRDSVARTANDATVHSSPGRVEGDVHAKLPHGVRLDGELQLQPAGIDVVGFRLHSNHTTLARVAALSPVVHDFVDGSVRHGSLLVDITGHMGREEDVFDFRLRAAALDIDVDRNHVGGAADIAIRANTDADGLRLRVAADLTGLAVANTDEHGVVVFSKSADSACFINASLTETGGRGSLGTALQRLDPASPEGVILFVGDGISPRWRRFGLGFSGRGSLRAKAAAFYAVPLEDISLNISLGGGRLRLDRAELRVFGGSADLGGTVVDLRPQPPRWALRLALNQIEAGAVLNNLRSITGDVRGRLSASADLHGSGFFIGSILSTLDGPVFLQTHDVVIAAVDAVGDVVDKFWAVLSAIPGVSPAEVASTRGRPFSEAIHDASWTWGIAGKALRVDQPTVTSLGLLTLSGHASLDGGLRLHARLDVDPAVLRIWGGDPEVPIEFLVAGTVAQPIVTFTGFAGVNLAFADFVARTDAVIRCELSRLFGDAAACRAPANAPLPTIAPAKSGGPAPGSSTDSPVGGTPAG